MIRRLMKCMSLIINTLKEKAFQLLFSGMQRTLNVQKKL